MFSRAFHSSIYLLAFAVISTISIGLPVPPTPFSGRLFLFAVPLEGLAFPPSASLALVLFNRLDFRLSHICPRLLFFVAILSLHGDWSPLPRRGCSFSRIDFLSREGYSICGKLFITSLIYPTEVEEGKPRVGRTNLRLILFAPLQLYSSSTAPPFKLSLPPNSLFRWSAWANK